MSRISACLRPSAESTWKEYKPEALKWLQEFILSLPWETHILSGLGIQSYPLMLLKPDLA